MALPPVFLPGAPENEDFVRLTLEGLEAARKALGTVLHAEKSDEPPKLKDLKKLSDGEIRKLGKTDDDAHSTKDIYGTGVDLYKDKKGNIYVGDKDGVGEPTPTGFNVRDFK